MQRKDSTTVKNFYKDLYGKPLSRDCLARVIFAKNILLISCSSCNHYFWDVWLKFTKIIVFVFTESWTCDQPLKKASIPLIEILCNILADMVGKKKEKQAAHELFVLPSTGSRSAQDVPVIQHGAEKVDWHWKMQTCLKKCPRLGVTFSKVECKKKFIHEELAERLRLR